MNDHVSLPAFSTMMMQNAEDMLHKIAVYSEICKQLAAIDDSDGFMRCGEKLLVDARAFSSHLKTMKTAPSLARETAVRLKAEGEAKQ
jgi:hypothetical protein